ncbi:hypothetical protein POVCU2_0026310 [Plasmodium ovale curtisi]|uniref:Uncharacterized protein n=1 Tax=Plasmodium ovale curtisi TaxID=864141 RepID=A0A1A8VVE7_PLAOA|nr:hypothetical protein POVCU2_0026310 [Plasmodium ovale curtisi]SBS92790.1 hypothetical protein POVCU1_024010 [Plasmodium ovale curtisi]
MEREYKTKDEAAKRSWKLVFLSFENAKHVEMNNRYEEFLIREHGQIGRNKEKRRSEVCVHKSEKEKTKGSLSEMQSDAYQSRNHAVGQTY